MEIVLCVEGMLIYMLYQLHSIKNASSSFSFLFPQNNFAVDVISIVASERNKETDLKVSDANAHPQKCHPFPLHPQICVRETNCTSCNTTQIHYKCNCCIPSLVLWTHIHPRVPVFEPRLDPVSCCVRVLLWCNTVYE